MQLKAIAVVILSIFPYLNSLLGEGIVIYKENGFDESYQTKIKHYQNYKDYSNHLEFTDHNGNEFELYKYNQAYIIDSSDNSDSSWDATEKLIKKAEEQYPHLINELTSFETNVVIARNSKKSVSSTKSASSKSDGNQVSILTTNLVTKAGEHYDNVIVKKVEPDGIIIEADDSIRKIKFTQLSDNVQKHYGYNPENDPEQPQSLLYYLRNTVWTWCDNDEIIIDKNLKVKNPAFGWTAKVQGVQGNDLYIILDYLGTATGRAIGSKAVLHFSADRESYRGVNFGGPDLTWGKLINQTSVLTKPTSLNSQSESNSTQYPVIGKSTSEGGVFVIPSKRETLVHNGQIFYVYPNKKYPVVGCLENFPIIQIGRDEVAYNVNYDENYSAKDIIPITPLMNTDSSVRIKDDSHWEIIDDPLVSYGQIYPRKYLESTCSIVDAPQDSYAIQFVWVNGQLCNAQTKIRKVVSSTLHFSGGPEWKNSTEGINYHLYFFQRGLREDTVVVSDTPVNAPLKDPLK